MMSIIDWLIVVSFFFLVYAYILYPILLIILSGLFRKKVNFRTTFVPDISILISAHNEVNLIEDCIKSILKQDYPINKIKILVGSDGSTDSTDLLLDKLSLDHSQLKALRFDRIGKNSVLNELMKLTDGSVTFFMDADIRLQDGVIYKLCEYLEDEKIGAVIASMKSIGDTGQSSGGFGELLYQRIENIFRIKESTICSTVSSLGAFYAVKNEYLKPLPDSKVADDFTPLLRVMLKRRRVVFVDSAEVIEVRGKSTGDEYQRRIRASSSAMTSLYYASKLLLPSYGWVSFFMISHRVLRWLTPVFLLLIFILTFFISNIIIYYVALSFQIFLYFGGVLGLLLEKLGVKLKIFKIPAYALNMNLGFAMAILRFFSTKKNDKWER
jgi:cellulose synthase/poly-beta-1,6-N-acetylglucosamine synthase-like glycosyltransferase